MLIFSMFSYAIHRFFVDFTAPKDFFDKPEQEDEIDEGPVSDVELDNNNNNADADNIPPEQASQSGVSKNILQKYRSVRFSSVVL